MAKRVFGKKRPTKRAADAGDSVAISSSFLRLIIFLAGRLRRPRPSAGIPYRGRWRKPLARSLQNIVIQISSVLGEIYASKTLFSKTHNR